MAIIRARTRGRFATETGGEGRPKVKKVGVAVATTTPGYPLLQGGVPGISLVGETRQMGHDLVVHASHPIRRQVHPAGPPAGLLEAGDVLARIRLHLLKLFPADNTHHDFPSDERAS